ncbi:hypothetical protein P691DRAFT_787943 [Macrolepiota fuliginosa MF-IS2]|uniref:DUF1793-domain-containing protein n=1 Tax=Macrolepiota fuliginosa MF-IS2 TaxID=1400762 RepID=A0A9P5X2R0_9AGAR|nr:hypothetical protein P691DRAFT_787943 [Macrolepiota fuliginosa MF-IS2]
MAIPRDLSRIAAALLKGDVEKEDASAVMLFRHTLQAPFLYSLLASANSAFPLGFIPLVVKTPYLQGWVASNGGARPALPNFVTSNRDLGWYGMIRVDNQTFQWMGHKNFTLPDTLTSEITPTASIFRFQAGPIEFNVTFLTPVEPTDYARQSIPFSYMFIDGFSASDSQAHNIQVYTEITAEWASSNNENVVVWNTTETDTMVYHRVTRESPLAMVTGNKAMAEDSIVYYATAKRTALTWQSGAAFDDAEAEFATNGSMANSRNISFRALGDRFPVFSFSVDLGTVSPGSQPDPVVVALGVVRDPLVTYLAEPESPPTSRSGYYWSAYSDIEEAISAFLSDSSNARNRNSVLDNKIMSAALAVSPEYADIVSLVTRQIFAAMDITIPSAQPGKFNSSDVKIFMKDMGASSRANPVEVIYGAFPALLYFNPSFARDLLVPLLDFQSSSLYKNPYAAPDLGTSYPIIVGNDTDTRSLAVENCGNMLIMLYAHAVKSGDGTLLSRYYDTLRGWADFLINNSLHPRSFITADGLNSPDMSNLALKGILGIYSMAKINEAVKISNNTYMDRAAQLITNWTQLAVVDGHIESVYGGGSDSWGLMYNLFPAIWLSTGLIDNRTLNLQAQFYNEKINVSNFGLILDTSQRDVAYPHGFSGVRNQLITPVRNQAYRMSNNFPLPIRYNPSTGDRISGTGSLPNIGIKAASLNGSQVDLGGRSEIGGIVGGIIGGLAFILVLASGGYLLWRKQQQKQQNINAAGREHHTDAPPPMPDSDYRGINAVQLLDNVDAGQSPLSSSKGQEVFGQRANKNRMRIENPTPNVSATLVASNRDPRESVPSTEGLRAEMGQLRRELDSIRHMTELPPKYT